MDNPTIIFTILILLVGLLVTAGYGLMSVAQYSGARVAFSATALLFTGIGIELGLVMAWPLPAKIVVAGCFGFAAAGALVYAFHSVSLLEKPAAAQPDIILLPPLYHYKFVWQASSNLEMIISPERPPTETAPLRTTIPIFQIKNIGSVVAKDVTIEWSINDINLARTVDLSNRLAGFLLRVTANKFGVFNGPLPEERIESLMNGLGFRGVVASPPYAGYASNYAYRKDSHIPYLAPELNNTGYQEADLPFDICAFVELYTVATLVDGPTPATVSVPIDVSIKWNNPEGSKPVKYRIDATAMNTKGWASVNGQPQNQTPDVLADIKFTVSETP